MSWWREPVWQQGIAIVLVIAGSVLIYLGAGGPGGMGGPGIALFAAGIILPLVTQLRRSWQERQTRRKDG
ncbi:MAG: hypothetical protein WDA25_10440 [Paracoccaceae bacterium]